MGIVATGVQKTEPKESFSPSSSFIGLIEYDSANKTLDITFHSGTKVRYLQCFPSTFLSFKQAQNHSVYYARALKGNLPSVKLVDNDIGRNESTPLKKVKKEQTLDTGLRKQQSRLDRIHGTVARAFAGVE